jgi:hypothetical protein
MAKTGTVGEVLTDLSGMSCWSHGGNHADDSIGSYWDLRDNQPS